MVISGDLFEFTPTHKKQYFLLGEYIYSIQLQSLAGPPRKYPANLIEHTLQLDSSQTHGNDTEKFKGQADFAQHPRHHIHCARTNHALQICNHHNLKAQKLA